MGDDMLNRILHHLDGGVRPPRTPADSPDEPPGGASAHGDAPDVERSGVSLSVPSWLGHKVVCSAHVIEQDDDRIVLSAPQGFETGQYVWLEREQDRIQCVVAESKTQADSTRLQLKYRPDRRRLLRKRTAVQGELEWANGLSRVRLPMAVTNLTDRGAQLRLKRPGPEGGEVVVRFDNREREAEVRYCRQAGQDHLVGVEFRR